MQSLVIVGLLLLALTIGFIINLRIAKRRALKYLASLKTLLFPSLQDRLSPEHADALQDSERLVVQGAVDFTLSVVELLELDSIWGLSINEDLLDLISRGCKKFIKRLTPIALAHQEPQGA